MRGIVGRDFSAFEGRSRSRRVLPIAVAVLVSAFGLVALRTEVLKLRYELAEGLEEEQRLLAERRDRTVAMRQLRDPMRLAEHAQQLGFVRPERVIDLTSASEAAPPRSRGVPLAGVDADASLSPAELRP